MITVRASTVFCAPLGSAGPRATERERCMGGVAGFIPVSVGLVPCAAVAAAPAGNGAAGGRMTPVSGVASFGSSTAAAVAKQAVASCCRRYFRSWRRHRRPRRRRRLGCQW
ncbi:unnamed protein product, partial [Ectocarpus sp. 12 AP-2014]